MYRFNTASGKYFHSIVFPSLRSETRDMRASSSLRSSASSHPSSHTASGRCCCNFDEEFYKNYMMMSFNTANGKHCCNRFITGFQLNPSAKRFNTVNGIYFLSIHLIFPSVRSLRCTTPPSSHNASNRCGCNCINYRHLWSNEALVSIPQAVSTVATFVFGLLNASGETFSGVSIPQAVSTVATILIISLWWFQWKKSFNTASGKHCCNKW